MTAPLDLPLRQAAEAIRAGELTPTELVGAALEAAEDPKRNVGAWAEIDGERALEAAAQSRPHKRDRPLAGVPVGVKDVIDVRGLVTRNGSRVHRPSAASQDAAVVARLRSAGAIVTGKTRTTEFATGAFGTPVRNPWDQTRIPGGSSSGSAAALAVRSCAAALGTDTAGSIRIPASLCGVAGLKPRHGSLPLRGITPLSPRLDCCGPLARDVQDLELVWRVLSGGRPTEPARRLSLGIPEAEIVETEPEVAVLVSAAVETLAEGASLVGVALSPSRRFDRDRLLCLLADAYAAHRAAGWLPERRLEYGLVARHQFDFGAEAKANDLREARERLRNGLEDEWRTALATADVIALPSCPVAAPAYPERPEWDPEVQPLLRQLGGTCGQANWCNLAAVTVPCGLTSEGLPVGLQLVGRTERIVLAAALRYEYLAQPNRPTVPPVPRTPEPECA